MKMPKLKRIFRSKSIVITMMMPRAIASRRL